MSPPPIILIAFNEFQRHKFAKLDFKLSEINGKIKFYRGVANSLIVFNEQLILPTFLL